MSDQTHIWPQNMGCKSSRRLSKYPKFAKIFTHTRTSWVQLVEYNYEFRSVCSAIIALWLSIILLPYYWLELETWWLMSCIAYVRFSHSHPQSNFRFPIFASYHHHLPICLQATVYPQFKPCNSTLVPLQCYWLWCHACSYGLYSSYYRTSTSLFPILHPIPSPAFHPVSVPFPISASLPFPLFPLFPQPLL